MPFWHVLGSWLLAINIKWHTLGISFNCHLKFWLLNLSLLKVIAADNQPVRWTTPLGLPVVQPYYKSERHLVSNFFVESFFRNQINFWLEVWKVDKRWEHLHPKELIENPLQFNNTKKIEIKIKLEIYKMREKVYQEDPKNLTLPRIPSQLLLIPSKKLFSL